MKLETFLDFFMDKDVHDVVIVDDKGDEINSQLPGNQYDKVEVITVNYLKIAHVKVSIEKNRK